MSSLNAARSLFSNAVANIQPYKGQLQLGLFLVVGVLLIYVIFMLVVPPADVYQQIILSDTRRGNELQGKQVQIKPPMYTGGEYTFQTWIYIDNYDYRSGQPKHVFTITSDGPPARGRPPHVTMMGVLYPAENKMMIRVYQAGAVEGFVDLRTLPESEQIAAFQNPSADTCTQLSNSPGGVPPQEMMTRALGLCAQSPAAAGMSAVQCAALSAMQKCKNGGGGGPSGGGADSQVETSSSPSQPDLTVLSNFKNLFQGQGTELGLKGTLDYPLCDIQNLPLQKWICLAIVMNGRVMDVYMDGKLARSCVLPGVPIVEKGNNVISLGMMGGWAGAMSTTRFYGYALTPDVVYSLYQEGPDVGRGLNNKYGFAGFLGERVGLRVDYSGL